MNFVKLREKQIAYLDAQESLRLEVEATIRPLIEKCRSAQDVIELKKDLRKHLGCCLDGLIEINLAIAFSGLFESESEQR